MLSAKQGGIKYHFLSLWYDSTWDWTLVSPTIGEQTLYSLGLWPGIKFLVLESKELPLYYRKTCFFNNYPKISSKTLKMEPSSQKWKQKNRLKLKEITQNKHKYLSLWETTPLWRCGIEQRLIPILDCRNNKWIQKTKCQGFQKNIY